MAKSALAERVAKAVARSPSENASAVRRDLETVQRVGITSVAHLIEAVGDKTGDPSIREAACSLLAELKERRAAKVLARALEDETDDGMEWVAAKALIRIRPKAAAPTLVRVLEQGDTSRQSAAAYALGWLEVASTSPALRKAATDVHLDAGVRGHAAEALGVMQARDAVADLITLLSDASPEVRYWAAFALGQIGDPASIPALKQMASTDVAVLPWDRSLKQEALDALASIRAREKGRIGRM